MTVGPTVAPIRRASTPNSRIVASSTSPPWSTRRGSTSRAWLFFRIETRGQLPLDLGDGAWRSRLFVAPPRRPRPRLRRLPRTPRPPRRTRRLFLFSVRLPLRTPRPRRTRLRRTPRTPRRLRVLVLLVLGRDDVPPRSVVTRSRSMAGRGRELVEQQRVDVGSVRGLIVGLGRPSPAAARARRGRDARRTARRRAHACDDLADPGADDAATRRATRARQHDHRTGRAEPGAQRGADRRADRAACALPRAFGAGRG